MLEIDAASRTKVDDTRDLLETVQFAPTRGRYKVYIIDEVHMLSTASFNALLKTLEEPPPHVKFVLATTDPQKIPVTILSRCLRFNLRRLLPDQIVAYLDKILADEGVQAEAGAVERIARAADGSMRDALSLLDQAIAYGGGALADDDVAQMMGSVDHAHVVAIVEALAAGNGAGLMEITRELASQARDLETVLVELSEVLHRVGLVQCVPDYRDPERSDWESIRRLAGLLAPEDVQLYYQIAVQGRRDLGLAPDPRTGLEMSLLRMLAFRPQPAAAAGGQGPGAAGGARAAGSTRKAADAGGSSAVAARPAQAQAVEARAEPELPPGSEERVDWHQLLDRLRLSGPVRELARNIQLESTRGGNWRFLIPDAVRHLGSQPMVKKLESALSSQLGHPVSLALHTASEPVPTPALLSEQAQTQQLNDAERAIEEDPTVRSLKERFGARVVDDSVQPLQ